MKTTLEIPDELFRQAKATAALRGISMKQLVSESLTSRLLENGGSPKSKKSPPWMRGFGKLADLSTESRQIEKLIEEEFEQIESEDLG